MVFQIYKSIQSCTIANLEIQQCLFMCCKNSVQIQDPKSSCHPIGVQQGTTGCGTPGIQKEENKHLTNKKGGKGGWAGLGQGQGERKVINMSPFTLKPNNVLYDYSTYGHEHSTTNMLALWDVNVYFSHTLLFSARISYFSSLISLICGIYEWIQIPFSLCSKWQSIKPGQLSKGSLEQLIIYV